MVQKTNPTANNLTAEETEMKMAFNLSVIAAMYEDIADRFPEKSRIRREAKKKAGEAFEMMEAFPFNKVRVEEFWKAGKLQNELNRQIHRLYYHQPPKRDARGRVVKR